MKDEPAKMQCGACCGRGTTKLIGDGVTPKTCPQCDGKGVLFQKGYQCRHFRPDWEDCYSCAHEEWESERWADCLSTALASAAFAAARTISDIHASDEDYARVVEDAKRAVREGVELRRERDEWKKAATKDLKMLHAAQDRIAELEAALRRAKDALVTEGACDDGDTIPWIDAALSPATAQPAPTAKPCPDCGGYGSMGHAASSSPAATNGSVTAEPSGNCKRCGEELAATVRGNHNTTQVTLACPKGCGMLAFVDTTKLSATPVEAVNSSNRDPSADASFLLDWYEQRLNAVSKVIGTAPTETDRREWNNGKWGVRGMRLAALDAAKEGK